MILYNLSVSDSSNIDDSPASLLTAALHVGSPIMSYARLTQDAAMSVLAPQALRAPIVAVFRVLDRRGTLIPARRPTRGRGSMMANICVS